MKGLLAAESNRGWLRPSGRGRWLARLALAGTTRIRLSACLHDEHRCSPHGSPSSPSLDGLEASGARLGSVTAPTPSTARRRASGSSRSTRRRRPSAARCTSAMSSPTRTRTRSRATSGCAAARSSIRWAGTTTACRPSAAYRTTTACAATRRSPTTPASSPGETPSEKEPVSISRPNFVELCLRLTESDERAFEALWRTLGLSVDWSMTYTTIGPVAQRISQRSFLGLLARGQAYQLEAPTLWDVDFQTAVAQAELRTASGRARCTACASAATATGMPATRADRDDAPGADPGVRGAARAPRRRASPRARGQTRATPLFGTSVPVLSHPLVERDKGTGLVMVCTFGDLTDVTWWRELSLPVRAILGPDGRLRDGPWGSGGWESQDLERARASYEELSGPTVNQARKRDRRAAARPSGELIGEPAAGHPRGEVLREGRAPDRDHHQQAVVHPHDRASADADRARARAAAGTRRSCARATRTGSNGLNGDWA